MSMTTNTPCVWFVSRISTGNRSPMREILHYVRSTRLGASLCGEPMRIQRAATPADVQTIRLCRKCVGRAAQG